MALVKDNEREELAAAYSCFLLHDAGVEVSVCAPFPSTCLFFARCATSHVHEYARFLTRTPPLFRRLTTSLS